MDLAAWLDNSRMSLVEDDEFMEETCDSEYSACPSYGFTSRSSSTKSAQFSIFADDAQSTTSENNELIASEPANKMNNEVGSSALVYLEQASDDELGLPPHNPVPVKENHCSRSVDLDLDFDFDADMLGNEDDDVSPQQSLFWLRFLRGD